MASIVPSPSNVARILASTVIIARSAVDLKKECTADKKKITEKEQRLKVKEKKHSTIYEHFCTVHHIFVVCACIYVACQTSTHRPSFLCIAMWWFYSDLYSAVLHCALDDKKSLTVPGIGPVAKGFQDHHDFPIESTAGKGLQMLFNDTVRGQWITLLVSLTFSRKADYSTLVMVLLKLVTCAYGTQVGHYYAHCIHLAPAPIKWLQRAHILLPPAEHWQHHKAPYAVNFGIVNGLSNYMLNPVMRSDRKGFSFEVVAATWLVLTAFDVAVARHFFALM